MRTVVADEDLPTALSQNQARQHVAGLLGAPLGGVLYAVARWLPFAADAVSFAVSWVLLGRIRTDLSAPTTNAPRRPVHDLAEGVRFIASRPFFRVLTVWSALTNLAVNALFFVAVLRLIEGGFPAFQIGLVETAAGLCGILGAIVAPWLIERTATGRLTVAVAWSFLPLVVPMPLWNQPAVVAAALAVGMFLNPAGNAGIGSYRMAVTPPELLGRVQATSAVRVDVGDAAGAGARRRPAVRDRRRPGDRGARRADGRGRSDPDPVGERPLGTSAGGVGVPRDSGLTARPNRCPARRPARPARAGSRR